ncbi:MAG: GNAT family N-acetyltransferase [Longimicrobiales bacterium]
MTGAGGRVVVRAGRLDEAARLDEIARTAKASWGYPPEWIERWADELRVDPRALAADEVFVAEVGGECVGWTSLATTALGPEIAHLWVAPDAQGRGVGRALLDAVLREAARRGWLALRVESDPHAVGFYEAMGGRVVDRVAAHLDGVERWLPVLEMGTVHRTPGGPAG